ncbi:MAG: hypothetical protein PSV16_00750, partial [Flavobacterium sp.]|nr:hypothetical protein [Flavobacterium sp.]
MSRKYKFGEKSGAYFISFATVFWIDVFTRDDYFCCITEALDGNVSDVLVSNQFLQYYQKIPPIGGTTTVRTTDYLNGFQYFEGKLEFFAT